MGARLRKLGKSGYYFGLFYDGDRRPREKSVPLGVRHKTEATKKFADLVRDWEAGRFDPWGQQQKQSPLSLSEAASRFLTDLAEQVERGRRRPKTAVAYRTALDGLVRVSPPGIMLAHLRKEDVRRYVRSEKADGSPPAEATERHRLRHVRAFLRWAKGEGMIDHDPTKGVKVDRPTDKRAVYLELEEVDRILIALDHHYQENLAAGYAEPGDTIWLRDVVRVAVGTGMRLGELCALRWSYIDLDAGYITLPKSVTKGKRERRVPLVADALACIERLHGERADELDGPVFTYRDGRPIKPSHASKRFKRYVRMARIDEKDGARPVRFHTLRHTCGAWLVSRRVPMRMVQEILGHQQLSTTEIYAHVAPDATRSIMAEALGG